MKSFQTINKNVYQQFDVWINNVFKKKNKQETRIRHFEKQEKKKTARVESVSTDQKNFFLGQATRFEIRTRRSRKFFWHTTVMVRFTCWFLGKNLLRGPCQIHPSMSMHLHLAISMIPMPLQMLSKQMSRRLQH